MSLGILDSKHTTPLNSSGILSETDVPDRNSSTNEVFKQFKDLGDKISGKGYAYASLVEAQKGRASTSFGLKESTGFSGRVVNWIKKQISWLFDGAANIEIKKKFIEAVKAQQSQLNDPAEIRKLDAALGRITLSGFSSGQPLDARDVQRITRIVDNALIEQGKRAEEFSDLFNAQAPQKPLVNKNKALESWKNYINSTDLTNEGRMGNFMRGEEAYSIYLRQKNEATTFKVIYQKSKIDSAFREYEILARDSNAYLEHSNLKDYDSSTQEILIQNVGKFINNEILNPESEMSAIKCAKGEYYDNIVLYAKDVINKEGITDGTAKNTIKKLLTNSLILRGLNSILMNTVSCIDKINIKHNIKNEENRYKVVSALIQTLASDTSEPYRDVSVPDNVKAKFTEIRGAVHAKLDELVNEVIEKAKHLPLADSDAGSASVAISEM